MPTLIFINLPVRDLERSKAFFLALGYTFNDQYTDENAACLVIREDAIFAMLLTHEWFSRYTKKPITDATAGTEVILALSADSREAVDEIVDKALASGGSPSNETDDLGYMYTRSFQDPDGHLWEVLYMDEAAMEEAMRQHAGGDDEADDPAQERGSQAQGTEEKASEGDASHEDVMREQQFSTADAPAE